MGVQTECRQTKCRQTKCQTDKMSNRQNVDRQNAEQTKCRQFFFFKLKKKIKKIKNKNKKIASFFCSHVVSELARFARGRIEDSIFNRFALNGIPELPAILFFGIEKF